MFFCLTQILLLIFILIFQLNLINGCGRRQNIAQKGKKTTDLTNKVANESQSVEKKAVPQNVSNVEETKKKKDPKTADVKKDPKNSNNNKPLQTQEAIQRDGKKKETNKKGDGKKKKVNAKSNELKSAKDINDGSLYDFLDGPGSKKPKNAKLEEKSFNDLEENDEIFTEMKIIAENQVKEKKVEPKVELKVEPKVVSAKPIKDCKPITSDKNLKVAPVNNTNELLDASYQALNNIDLNAPPPCKKVEQKPQSPATMCTQVLEDKNEKNLQPLFNAQQQGKKVPNIGAKVKESVKNTVNGTKEVVKATPKKSTQSKDQKKSAEPKDPKNSTKPKDPKMSDPTNKVAASKTVEKKPSKEGFKTETPINVKK
uniref:Uncharacterized protein n=1 Tax=Strongyloides stercoralis TaxID=6248 RepID=A0A0K0EFF3_STRER